MIDITPNIQCWSDDEDPLKDYLESLDKVRALDVKWVLPGHRRLFKNCRKRIDELKAHHAQRLEEVLDILAERSSLNAFQIASHMTWDIKAENWEPFPPGPDVVCHRRGHFARAVSGGERPNPADD